MKVYWVVDGDVPVRSVDIHCTEIPDAELEKCPADEREAFIVLAIQDHFESEVTWTELRREGLK